VDVDETADHRGVHGVVVGVDPDVVVTAEPDPVNPNTVQLGARARMVIWAGPLGWGQSAWRVRLTCHRGILRLMTRGLDRFRRIGLSRFRRRLMA